MSDEQQREYKHVQRMIRICRKVIATSERHYLITGKHRHDYEVAKRKLAELDTSPFTFAP